MIIDSADFGLLPKLRSAVLNECGDAVSTLVLSWAGYGPDWLRYMEPVTVMHRGSVLFHGRVTEFSHSNEGGSVSAEATVSNALWLLDNTPLGAQVAEAMGGATADFEAAAREALRSWTALAASCRVAAPGWVVDEAGMEADNGLLWLEVRRANYSTGAVVAKNRVITAWTALLSMRQANPDALFRFVPTSGAVEVVSVGQAFDEVWRTDEMLIYSCAGIGPQFENCVTGVALVVSWGDAVTGGEGGSLVRVYPASVQPGDSGVRIFTVSVENEYQATEQAEYVMGQLQSYYEAVNELQYGGTVEVALEDVVSSPLAHRLSLVGPGTHESWHEMRAMVTAVRWDFMEHRVEVTLGAVFGEPEIHEMSFPETPEGDDSRSRFSTGGSSSSSTGSDSGSGPIVLPPGKTEPWSPPEWESTWDTVSRDSTETPSTISLPSEPTPSEPTPSEPTPSEPTPSEPTPSTTMPSESTPTAMPGSGCDCDCPERWAGFEEWKKTVENRLGKVPQPCGCADKWASLDVWKQGIEDRLVSLEKRVQALEDAGGGGGSCDCQCGDLLAQIQAAIAQAASAVTVSASVGAPVMTTATGDLGISCVAEVTADGGSGSVSFSY